MKKEIIKSKHNGFCPFVEVAINKTCNAKLKYDDIYTSSIVVHNRKIQSALDVKNADNDINNIDFKSNKTKCMVISAHGAKSSFINDLKKNNIDIIDATCPIVKKITEKTISTDNDIIYIGDKNHSEAKFFLDNVEYSDKLNGKTRNIIVVCSPDDVRSNKDFFIGENNIDVFVQTTFKKSEYDSICKEIDKYSKLLCIKSINFESSICPDCLKRREDAVNLAKSCDCVIVVGDDMSNNAKELFYLALDNLKSKKVYLVIDENQEEIEKCKNDDSIEKIGIISSASSSKVIFDKVCSAFEIQKVNFF